MNADSGNLLTRRSLLLQLPASFVTSSLYAGQQRPASSGRSSERDLFRIRALDRKYDLHRQKGCTLLAIEVDGWPGNEFGLWLPETVYLAGKVAWGNWWDNAHQEFEQDAGGRWITKRAFDQFTVTSMLTPDPARACLWYRHTFRNTGSATLHDLNSQTCFHLVNAPQFISLQGSRIWAKLDGKWTTTDKVDATSPRIPAESRFSSRVCGRSGPLSHRRVSRVPSCRRSPHHPLFIAENFEGKGCVAIAARNFEKLFNNNDPILRCLHSESLAIKQLEPGETADQDSVIIFYNGDHSAILNHYTMRIAPHWPPS